MKLIELFDIKTRTLGLYLSQPPKKSLPESLTPKSHYKFSNPKKVLRLQISNPKKGFSHRIAEIVFDSIFVTHITEPIPAASVAFMAKQDLYDFAEGRLFDSLMHLIPAHSRSLPHFHGEILLVNYLTKLWREEVLNGFGNC